MIVKTSSEIKNERIIVGNENVIYIYKSSWDIIGWKIFFQRLQINTDLDKKYTCKYWGNWFREVISENEYKNVTKHRAF